MINTNDNKVNDNNTNDNNTNDNNTNDNNTNDNTLGCSFWKLTSTMSSVYMPPLSLKNTCA